MQDDDGYLPTSAVLRRYGISQMTLWRWEHDEKINFPNPLVVNRRKLYPISGLRDWEIAQAATSPARAVRAAATPVDAA